jgi:hypothetical protein
MRKHVGCTGRTKVHAFFLRREKWCDVTYTYLEETGCGGDDRVQLAQDRI